MRESGSLDIRNISSPDSFQIQHLLHKHNFFVYVKAYISMNSLRKYDSIMVVIEIHFKPGRHFYSSNGLYVHMYMFPWSMKTRISFRSWERSSSPLYSLFGLEFVFLFGLGLWTQRSAINHLEIDVIIVIKYTLCYNKFEWVWKLSTPLMSF